MVDEKMPLHGPWQVKSLTARAKARRSLAEKIADGVVNASGTLVFLVVNAIWFVVWLAINLGVLGNQPFDPYPFAMLTTMVSLEAIALAIFVLISQNRAAKIADLREEVDLQLDVITEKEITKVLELVTRIARKQGIDISKDETLKEMLKEVDRDKIEHVLTAQVDGQ